MLTLRAAFLADISKKRRGFTGARCELPNGQVVECLGRRTPLYDLARKLNALGFGDWLLQGYTPTGTPSVRGKVSIMAGLAVTERDRRGLNLEIYRAMPVRGALMDDQETSEGSLPAENANTPLKKDPAPKEAA